MDCEIPFSCKLDCTILTPVTVASEGTPLFSYIQSEGTINLAHVSGYYTFVKPDGTVDEEACVLVIAPLPIVVRKTYAEIDAIINPE